MPDDFKHCTLPQLNKPVLRLGVAGNYGITSDDIVWAAEHGVRYWLCGFTFDKVTKGLKEILRKDREAHVVALLGMGAFGWQVRRSVESVLRKLSTDYLDVFKLGWLGVTSRMSPAIIDTLLALKHAGKIRAIGASIHDRPRAGRLAEDSALDLLMIRYNAKHPGAEQDIFPHLARRNPAVVAYTATAWRQLTRPVRGIEMPPWPNDGAPPPPPLTADLCYRFVLTNPHVHVALTGPADRAQLASNLEGLDQGPLSPEELEWVRAYGQTIRRVRRRDYV